jgi:hypothetical protein
MAATTKQRGNATGSCSSVETDCGLDEEDPSPSPLTSSAVIGSDPVEDQVVKEEATPESRQMAATRTNQRGEATLRSRSSVEEDGGAGRDEQDSKQSLVPSRSSALIGSYPEQEVVKEDVTTPNEIPSG